MFVRKKAIKSGTVSVQVVQKTKTPDFVNATPNRQN